MKLTMSDSFALIFLTSLLTVTSGQKSLSKIDLCDHFIKHRVNDGQCTPFDFTNLIIDDESNTIYGILIDSVVKLDLDFNVVKERSLSPQFTSDISFMDNRISEKFIVVCGRPFDNLEYECVYFDLDLKPLGDRKFSLTLPEKAMYVSKMMFTSVEYWNEGISMDMDTKIYHHFNCYSSKNFKNTDVAKLEYIYSCGENIRTTIVSFDDLSTQLCYSFKHENRIYVVRRISHVSNLESRIYIDRVQPERTIELSFDEMTFDRRKKIDLKFEPINEALYILINNRKDRNTLSVLTMDRINWINDDDVDNLKNITLSPKFVFEAQLNAKVFEVLVTEDDVILTIVNKPLSGGFNIQILHENGDRYQYVNETEINPTDFYLTTFKHIAYVATENKLYQVPITCDAISDHRTCFERGRCLWENNMCKVKNNETSKMISSFPIIAGSSAVAVVLLVAVLVVVFDRLKKVKPSRSPQNNIRMSSPSINLSSMELIEESVLTSLKETNKLIESDLLNIGDIIGEGHFGEVYKGNLTLATCLLEVAIKTPKNLLHDPNSVKLFLKEALLTQKFDHEHVMSLIGICFQQNSPHIILPFMSNGDLLKYLRNNLTLGQDTLMKFSREIALGMEYLVSKQFVHRDLAARNCLLTSNLSVKVADFGLTRHLYDAAYYKMADNARLPIFWMAIESLERHLFNEKADMWSYGVTCREIFTLGRVPYVGIEPSNVVDKLKDGYRLKKPNKCPQEVYEFMLTCWCEDPDDRPSFSEAVESFAKPVEGEDTNYNYFQTN